MITTKKSSEPNDRLGMCTDSPRPLSRNGVPSPNFQGVANTALIYITCNRQQHHGVASHLPTLTVPLMGREGLAASRSGRQRPSVGQYSGDQRHQTCGPNRSSNPMVPDQSPHPTPLVVTGPVRAHWPVSTARCCTSAAQTRKAISIDLANTHS